jgi:predicted nucleic acid-binding protein
LGSIFVYGLFIFEGIAERVVTIMVGIAVSVVTVIMLQRGALNKRLVVELREDQSRDGQSVFTLTLNGKPTTADVCLVYADGQRQVRAATGEIPTFPALRAATFDLPVAEASELKVWVHKITPEWSSEGLPALLTVHCGDQEKAFDLNLCSGQVVLPIPGETCRLQITLPERLI